MQAHTKALELLRSLCARSELSAVRLSSVSPQLQLCGAGGALRGKSVWAGAGRGSYCRAGRKAAVFLAFHI